MLFHNKLDLRKIIINVIAGMVSLRTCRMKQSRLPRSLPVARNDPAGQIATPRRDVGARNDDLRKSLN
jgi:hypothetical protein